MEPETRDQGVIRKMLRNDYAVIVTIAGAVLGFAMTVVVPIQKMQLQIGMMQTQLAEQLTEFKGLSTDTATIKANLENLTKKEDDTQKKLDTHIQLTR